ncbi:MAG TPA: PKD domain-containing protein [Baekduia sp.]|nr:PKD domain-containing protein [Baekduia sp.]
MFNLMLRCALLTFLIALAAGPAASAAVGPPTTIDGPAAAVGQLGGVAQAPDGTGGVVYLRAQDGRQHVYAARFDGRAWSSPQRLDTALPFDSAWPRIGAADGGRLVVVWAQHAAQGVDALYSATLMPGAQRFLAPTILDFALGGDDAVYPSLAMNGSGNALLAYRAIPSTPSADVPAGYVRGAVRVARFNGSRWQKLGVPVNRNPASAQPTPTAANAPQVALDAIGNGVVAWQEPDDDFIARVWARRIFGTRFGVVRAASPLTAQGQPVRGGADQPAVAVTSLGRAVVAFRQLPDPRSRSVAPRLYLNQIEFDQGTFGGPQLVGDAGDATPALGLDRDDSALAFARAGSAILGLAPRLPGPVGVFGQQAALPDPPPVLVSGVDGRAVLASAGDAGGGEVSVSELEGSDLTARTPLSTEPGGPIRELAAAGTGNGDALVAFSQGVDNDRQIAVALVDAPPAPFTLEIPAGWSRARSPEITWTAADDVLGTVVYTVSVDGRTMGRTRATAMRLREGVLDQGSHRVTVVATDPAGHATTADPGFFRLDRQAPLASFAPGRRRVTVRLRDPGGKSRAAGVAKGATSITWGDGRSTQDATSTASHKYRRAGRYTVSVSASDAAGNRVVVRRAVRIP